MTDQRQARIEAAWNEVLRRHDQIPKDPYRVALSKDDIAAAIDTADTVAAPAVGVTVDAAETLVSNLLYLYRCIGYGDTKRGLFQAFEDKRSEIIALLTAKPEPEPDGDDEIVHDWPYEMNWG